jgi:ribosomal protein S18 acetylase RimI-like enzyme
MECVLLSELPRDGKLFEDCIRKLSEYSSDWPREKIMRFLDFANYDCFLLVNHDGNFGLAGVIAFNPDRQKNIAKVFFIYVLPQFRNCGVGAAMTSEFTVWLIKKGFKEAQVGLGKNPAATALLKSLNRHKKNLLCNYASRIEINPETGVVIIK